MVTAKLGLNQVSIAREQAQFAKANSRLAQQKLILDPFDKKMEYRNGIARGDSRRHD
jgi:hypothetical protein